MDTKRIEKMSSLINTLKSNKNFVVNDAGIYTFVDLPYTENNYTQDIEDEIIAAMNKAAKEVAAKHIIKTEKKLINIFKEIIKESIVMEFELESKITNPESDSDYPLKD
jgi:short-subunit dehydrogenase involved in D-alanine esterification of teichoic acids